MTEQTLAHIVDNFHSLGSETAYVQRRGLRTVRWSYGQVARCIRQLARELAERGIGPGDRVFLWGEDCAEWVVSFFACVLRGASVVPADRAAGLEFLRRVHGQVEARLCICSEGQNRIDPSLDVLTFDSFSDLPARHSSAPLSSPELSSRDTVEIVFTSGTTAEPRGVVLSHKNIFANLEPLEREIRKYRKFERVFHPLRFLNVLPLSHVFGQFLGIFIPQILGSTVVFQDTLNPSGILQTIKRERISALITVPRILEAMRDKVERDIESEGALQTFQKEFRAADGEHFLRRWWRFRNIHRRFGWKFWAFISGGASLSPEVERFWERLGFAVIQGYGLTETTSLISINHPFKLGKGSVGKILPGREVTLAPDGEILVRGGSVAESYYQEGGTIPVPGSEGWFHTGDVGSLDEKGNLYFKGRRKNVIVSPEGMNIYPEDLEAALRQQPEVRDCVVVGLDCGGNAQPCAVLILRHKDPDPELAIRRANESLAEFQKIRNWIVWPEEDFPRTSTHKPRIPIIKQFAESHSAPSPPAHSRIMNELLSRLTRLDPGRIHRDATLAQDLQLSSIERVELLSALEDRFQVDLDESAFQSAATVGDLEKVLRRQTRRGNAFCYPRWTQRAPAAVFRILVYYLVLWPATLLLAWPRIHGRENLRNLKGPLLFASNHITQLDIGFILAALPARFRHRLAVAMNGEMLQEMRDPPCSMGFVKRLAQEFSYWSAVALFNVFPLPQRAGFRESFAFAGESADRGYSILIFPEGTRTRDGKMSPFRAGTGILATNLRVPVIPIRIDGLWELKKAGKKMARPGSVSVTIGPPARYSKGMSPSEIALDLFRHVSDI